MSDGFLRSLYRRLFPSAVPASTNESAKAESRTFSASPEQLNAAIKSAASIRHLRLPENVPGKYYVNDSCIDCAWCCGATPEFFRRHDEKGYSYVHRQPANEEEEERLRSNALEGCCIEAIRDDGETPTPP